MTPEDAELLTFLRAFNYANLPGPSYEEWEAVAWRLHEVIRDGRRRDLAREVIPLMCTALEQTSAADMSLIDVRQEAIHLLGWAPELLDEQAVRLLRAAVVEDN